MIKIKLAQLVNAMQSKALDRLMEMAMPIKTTFRLRQITKQVNEKLADYHKLRDELFTKYGAVANQESGIWEFDKANVPVINEEHTSLTSTDIELTGEPFKMRDFLSSAAISVNDLDLLAWLIIDETEPAVAPIPEQLDLPREPVEQTTKASA